jgi:hypothetical protein
MRCFRKETSQYSFHLALKEGQSDKEMGVYIRRVRDEIGRLILEKNLR